MTPLITLLVGKDLFLEREERGKLEEKRGKGMEGKERRGRRKGRKEAHKGSFVSCQKLIFVYVAERRGEAEVFVASSASSLHLHFGPFSIPLSPAARFIVVVFASCDHLRLMGTGGGEEARRGE